MRREGRRETVRSAKACKALQLLGADGRPAIRVITACCHCCFQISRGGGGGGGGGGREEVRGEGAWGGDGELEGGREGQGGRGRRWGWRGGVGWGGLLVRPHLGSLCLEQGKGRGLRSSSCTCLLASLAHICCVRPEMGHQLLGGVEAATTEVPALHPRAEVG